MSYCRWSSDDWRCDIYCYESERGYEVHVAGSRLVPAEPFPPPNVYESPDVDAAVEAIVERHHEVMRIIRLSAREPIGLPFDGESYSFGEPGEAANKLESLRAAGYHVPQYAIDELREEAAETANPPYLKSVRDKS